MKAAYGEFVKVVHGYAESRMMDISCYVLGVVFIHKRTDEE